MTAPHRNRPRNNSQNPARMVLYGNRVFRSPFAVRRSRTRGSFSETYVRITEVVAKGKIS
jgi:hypothetical protein